MEAKGMLDKLRDILPKGGDNRNRLIVAVGLAGMLLILLSSFWSSPTKSSLETEPNMMTTAQYISYMEDRICNIVTSIDGVGKAKVMVTLESGVEYVFAREEKQNTDLLQDFGTEGSTLPRKVQEKNSNQVSYILVEGSSGKKQALVEQQLEPKIQGVIVLCQGAGSPIIEQRVTEALKIALNLSSNRVCVTKISD